MHVFYHHMFDLLINKCVIHGKSLMKLNLINDLVYM